MTDYGSAQQIVPGQRELLRVLTRDDDGNWTCEPTWVQQLFERPRSSVREQFFVVGEVEILEEYRWPEVDE